MERHLVVLGSASQVPTRQRNHNGYALQWDRHTILFDPGEGTQRQMLLAGIRSTALTHIAITHRHGDHSLGLPGVLQRMVLDQRRAPVTLSYPEPAAPYIDMLLTVADVSDALDVIHDPRSVTERVMSPLGNTASSASSLVSVPLDHRVPTVGYRIQEPDGIRMDPEKLAEAGLEGPVVGQLRNDRMVEVDGREVHLDQVSRPLVGQAAAFVMDTRMCNGIGELLDGCDLAIVEATYLQQDVEFARAYGHLTAAQAGQAAATAGVRRLAMTHFSQRYPDTRLFVAEAGAHHDDVLAVEDFDIVDVPSRRLAHT